MPPPSRFRADPRHAIRRALMPLLVLGLVLAAATMARPSMAGTSPDEALQLGMRKLWTDHVMWTRLVIVSTAGNVADLDATTARLMQNQTDIGNAIKPYYGEDAGNQLTALLKRHIAGAADILAAAKANDNNRMNRANDAWHANADTIATFLSNANPKSWPLTDMKAMMKEHLDLTLSEAQQQLKGDFAASISDYDKVHDQILTMADALTRGIVEQHPKDFMGANTASGDMKKLTQK